MHISESVGTEELHYDTDQSGRTVYLSVTPEGDMTREPLEQLIRTLE